MADNNTSGEAQETGESTASNNDSSQSQPQTQTQSQSQTQSQTQSQSQSQSQQSAPSQTQSQTQSQSQQQQSQQSQQINAKKQLENIKGQCRNIVAAFRDEQNDITRALQSYKYLLTTYKSNQVYNEECRDFIRDRFLEDSCVALMKREHHHFQQDWNMADEINNCCKLLIQIAVPLIKDDSILAMQIIYNCLNTSNPFFRHFGHDWVNFFFSFFVLFFFYFFFFFLRFCALTRIKIYSDKEEEMN